MGCAVRAVEQRPASRLLPRSRYGPRFCLLCPGMVRGSCAWPLAFEHTTVATLYSTSRFPSTILTYRQVFERLSENESLHNQLHNTTTTYFVCIWTTIKWPLFWHSSIVMANPTCLYRIICQYTRNWQKKCGGLAPRCGPLVVCRLQLKRGWFSYLFDHFLQMLRNLYDF